MLKSRRPEIFNQPAKVEVTGSVADELIPRLIKARDGVKLVRENPPVIEPQPEPLPVAQHETKYPVTPPRRRQ